MSLPREKLCCGRPYYDFGLLDKAKASLEHLVRALAPRIESGTPVVVLEPGCLSVFKDEMAKLLPDDACAAKLAKQAVSLGELLQARGWKPHPIGGKALLHGHCHQKALGNTGADLALLPKVRATPPETLIVANGFSCREQIEGLAGRETMHLAEVLARAL